MRLPGGLGTRVILMVGLLTREGEPASPRVGMEALDHRLHRSLVEDRVRRLLHPAPAPPPTLLPWRWGLSAAGLALLLFFVL